jgi:Ca2+-binding RTX toxin-like protein
MTRTTHRLAAAVAVLPLTVATPVLVASSSSATVGPAARPTAQPTATFAKGVLTVHGTRKGQTMTVARKGRKVTVRVGGAKVPLPKGYTNRKCDEIRIIGLAGNDQMTVDSSKGRLPEVVLVGGKGDDVLTGGTRSDVLDGGQGNDVLRPGDAGSDVLDGGIGADIYLVDADLTGQATIVEPDADGPDHLSFAATGSAVTMDLASTTSQQVSTAYNVVLPHLGIEELTGGDGDDHLLGGNTPDTELIGSDLANRLSGGTGSDTLTGNGGADTFAPTAPSSFAGVSSADTITDFATGIDTVDLTGLTIKSGLGTSTVTVWDGVHDHGTITASNGHLWTGADFS